VQWGRPNVLRIDFDNGGREYFVVHPTAESPVGSWSAALLNARDAAPDLDYGVLPALKPGFEQPAWFGARRMLMYWTLGMVALCLLCSVLSVVVSALGR
jgi:hypothetical protein